MIDFLRHKGEIFRHGLFFTYRMILYAIRQTYAAYSFTTIG